MKEICQSVICVAPKLGCQTGPLIQLQIWLAKGGYLHKAISKPSRELGHKKGKQTNRETHVREIRRRGKRGCLEGDYLFSAQWLSRGRSPRTQFAFDCTFLSRPSAAAPILLLMYRLQWRAKGPSSASVCIVYL